MAVRFLDGVLQPRDGGPECRRGDYVFDDAAVATVAPKGVDSGTSRVKRGGGSYEHGRDYLRCAKRDASSPDSASRYNGFRLYCSIPVDP